MRSSTEKEYTQWAEYERELVQYADKSYRVSVGSNLCRSARQRLPVADVSTDWTMSSLNL